jgi:hypothetical protein
MAFGAPPLRIASFAMNGGRAARMAADYAALVTLFERRQRVHTRMRFTPPLINARTSCRFGSKRRALTLFAWLCWRPTTGFFPQISQCFAIGFTHSPNHQLYQVLQGLSTRAGDGRFSMTQFAHTTGRFQTRQPSLAEDIRAPDCTRTVRAPGASNRSTVLNDRSRSFEDRSQVTCL